jgi:hypothetical protein
MNGGTCTNGTCSPPCGAAGSACCTTGTTACLNGGCCDMTAGAPGTCYALETKCSGNGTVCGASQTMVGTNTCQNCGGHNQDCCSDAGMVCNPHTPARTCKPNGTGIYTCQ